MLSSQIEFNLSKYSDLYDLVVPKTHFLRKFKELVDFSFIYNELENKYCLNNGRNAKSPILLFKYLILKYLYNLSDEGVVERSCYDLSFKFFLDLTPEDEVIHPSLLTKFRKQRLKDENLLDLLINKSIEIAIANGVLKNKAVIVDSTHTEARYRKITQHEMLKKQADVLKKSLNNVQPDTEFPKCPEKCASTDEYIEYCADLIDAAKNSSYSDLPAVHENMSMLEEMLDNKIDCYDQSFDTDARIGHKGANKAFYGYKTHIAMTEERIITAATVTSGEAFDGTELPALVKKSKDAGVTVEEVIADTAYSTIDNLKDAEAENYRLISKLNPSITKGNRAEDDFFFNKDAGTMQCPGGYLATSKKIDNRTNSNKNKRIVYYFDVNKCKSCPHRDGCYKDGAKHKSYSVTIKSNYHEEQSQFQETPYFKKRLRNRYMIEAKNSELKNIHGYDQCDSFGLDSMQLQGAVSIFVVNIKRILHLMGEVCPDEKK